jgi:DNA polymerase-3 subunit epsilon
MHNAKFDLGFLEQEMKAIQKSFSFPKIICSVELSQALYPQEKSHNLNAISKRCGLSIKKGEERHRALGDVILTAEVLIRFSEENPLIFSGMLDQLCTSIEK